MSLQYYILSSTTMSSRTLPLSMKIRYQFLAKSFIKSDIDLLFKICLNHIDFQY